MAEGLLQAYISQNPELNRRKGGKKGSKGNKGKSKRQAGPSSNGSTNGEGAAAEQAVELRTPAGVA